MSDDEIRDPIAAMDQALRGMKDFARTMFSYYRDLVIAGFSPVDAMTLAVSFQTTALLHALESAGDES